MATYWIKRGDEIRGPFSGTNVRSLVDLGQVQGHDLIGPSQSGPWQPISQVASLSAKIKTENVSMQTIISLPPVQHDGPVIMQPQPMATPPLQSHYPAPSQQPQYQAPSHQGHYPAPAPQIIYVQVPQTAAQPLQIYNNVTSSNVNQNRNTAVAVGGSSNAGAIVALLCFIGAMVCMSLQNYNLAVPIATLGVLASLAGFVLSFFMWGRGMAVSLVLLLCNGGMVGFASSKQYSQNPKASQTASHGVLDRGC